MALSSYPFDAQATTETQYSQLFRELQDSGVVDSAGGTGWRVSADASGMTVKLAAGFALVRGHAILSTGIESLTIAAAESQARTDRIVLRLDPSTNSIVPAVKKGTAGSGVPTLTQTDTGIFELPLARIAVAVGAVNIAALAVTDEREYVGTRVRAWTDTTRPTSPRKSQLGLNTGSNLWEFSGGAAWKTLTPVINWETIEGRPATFAPVAHRHSWNDIDGKPSTFLPSSHTHGTNQISGLDGHIGWATATLNAFSGQITDLYNSKSHIGHGHNAHQVTVDQGGNVQGQINHLHSVKSNWDHGHGDPHRSQVSTRSEGTDRAHQFQVGGPGPYYAVYVDGAGWFGRNTSSRRYKQNIRDVDIIPADVLALRPVVYDRKATPDPGDDTKMRPGNKDEFGLIAEEVHETLPEIVTWHDGKIDAVRYDLLAVALLSLVKDHEVRIADLEARLAELTV